MPTSTRLCFPKSWRGPVGHVHYTRVTPQSIVDRALTVFVLVSFTVGPKAWSDAMLRDKLSSGIGRGNVLGTGYTATIRYQYLYTRWFAAVAVIRRSKC